MGLTKTVYNPAVLKTAQRTSEEALKKKQVRNGWKFGGAVIYKSSKKNLYSIPIFNYTGSSKTAARCEEEEAGNIGEAH